MYRDIKMKICILRICAILSMFYLDLGAYAKQLEMRGEAPKTTKQKYKEELQRQRYWQEQARKNIFICIIATVVLIGVAYLQSINILPKY